MKEVPNEKSHLEGIKDENSSPSVGPEKDNELLADMPVERGYIRRRDGGQLKRGSSALVLL